MQAYVTGMGWITAIGMGRGRETDHFSAPDGVVPIPSRRQVFQTPDDRFGRMDAFSKIGIAAIALALEDAALADFTEKRPIGIVASTQRGCLSTDMAYFNTVLADQGQWPSPHLFTYTLPSCFLGEAALRFGLTGPAYILHEPRTFSLAGIRAALRDLSDGEAGIMIAGACDLPWPGELAPMPDQHGDGAPGAAFIVLERYPRHESEPYSMLQGDSEEIFVGNYPMHSLDELIVCLREQSSMQAP